MEGPGKLYYGIKEVAEKFGINASKLRYYEKEFPTLQPKKNRAGDRVYTQADIDQLTEILDLIDRQKYTLPGAREFLKQREARRQEAARYVGKLQKIKSFLEQMRADLDKPQDDSGEESE
ncbi:MerR family transcriptional regulator [Spirosoma sp. BT702]|uniref:MerR family transcriptional regulator n=1 Tax=Spirosoma profusum TaxID=2771354 RepID=A0A926Y3I2_9BACT|nr:MerR family transcriptional regulator [Spirosoma profusum]MBD2701930.1 MerR family transcriptional regulator [Spirosoma profusum]